MERNEGISNIPKRQTETFNAPCEWRWSDAVFFLHRIQTKPTEQKKKSTTNFNYSDYCIMQRQKPVLLVLFIASCAFSYVYRVCVLNSCHMVRAAFFIKYNRCLLTFVLVVRTHTWFTWHPDSSARTMHTNAQTQRNNDHKILQIALMPYAD